MNDFANLETFFSGTVTAMALLSGFSFAAALQVMGSEQLHRRGAHLSAFMLYVATLLFLFAMWGFIRISAIDTDLNQIDEGGFTGDFYRAYLVELGIALGAVIAFLVGMISSAWIRSPIMGKALLALVVVALAVYGVWFAMV